MDHDCIRAKEYETLDAPYCMKSKTFVTSYVTVVIGLSRAVKYCCTHLEKLNFNIAECSWVLVYILTIMLYELVSELSTQAGCDVAFEYIHIKMVVHLFESLCLKR